MRENYGHKVETITGTITLRDGSTSEFTIGTDAGWHQGGADRERLGLTVDVLEAMARALVEDNLLVSDSDPDEGACRVCTGPTDNGEGWDGLCGTCADRAEYGAVYAFSIVHPEGDVWTEDELTWEEAAENIREYIETRRPALDDATLDEFIAGMHQDTPAELDGFTVTLTRDEDDEDETPGWSQRDEYEQDVRTGVWDPHDGNTPPVN